ncbi:MAG: AbrB/MazE/SpoVT family DNA-binding domain-containing protein, partial [Deltaproteobacteria bacterium]|nr:AbrB/MazE/SpoVT family DNA-binding domain-containing protein [Deltaproteobacteria bacterium]
WPLIYLPKEAIQRLGLKRGTRILISIDGDERLIIRPIK